MIWIRPEQPDDAVAVRTINETAFGQAQEADIVDAIRRACPDTVSLVADSDGQLVDIRNVMYNAAVYIGGAPW